MTKPKILLQLDCDEHASVFDAVVAIDAGVDHLLQYASVAEDNVTELVHGAIFTRSPSDLASTAIFIGGSDLSVGERLLARITKTMFDPLRVSVVLDSNGSNSTAAAAVCSAAKHIELEQASVVVLGGTGAVGRRVARMLAGLNCRVIIGSRDHARAAQVAAEIQQRIDGDQQQVIEAIDYSPQQLDRAIQACGGIISCGAAGVPLLNARQLDASSAKVVIDLNAVPPAGIEGVEVTDKATHRDHKIVYGAIGVGGLKMKVHKEAIRRAFDKPGQVFDGADFLKIAQIASESK